MVFKSFRINCILRIVGLAATMFLFLYLLAETDVFTTTIIVGLIIVMQVVSLIHYIEKTNRNLTRFLSSIRYSDFAESFSGGPSGASFAELNAAFAEVVAEFRRTRSEKEEQYRYLQTIIQHIGLGILSFERDGKVDLINGAAKCLLQVGHLNNVRSLKKLSPELVEVLFSEGAGKKSLIKIDNGGDTLTLVLFATEFRLRDRVIRLVSMQNIESELAEQEMAAWQKLIRVLTHEIMNSITPIASLASTVNGLLDDQAQAASDNQAVISDDTFVDVRDAVATIEKRSQGLLHFVDAYRNLTRIPTPDFQIFSIGDMLGRVTQLMQAQFEKRSISCSVDVSPASLELLADPQLVEQVLINLVVNAVAALQQTASPHIELSARLNDYGRIAISVADNGPGLSDDIKDKIFTPFFTTKKDGSGIWLSLSRQIMRLHKGNISVQSVPGQQTRFSLRF